MTTDDLVVTRWATRFMGRLFSCSIGKGGLSSDKREGDGATPAGVLRIAGMLYRPDRLEAPTTWARPIGPADLWSDDPTAADYNQLVRAPYAPSHEALRRADPLYDLILLTDWNYPVSVPGLGSAIFIHRWRKPRHPTEGCVAFSPGDLLWIAQRVNLGTRVVVRP
ncbi:L,D-peptidoglycan transpeptidase YkuD (ErfK/YbiS/YcfS/YnhG family) [Litoreibacter meonggei]|uniref:L,D-peptidoglycan transpeptidase YkuD (ErfK/YbiS/YcfS/YnhG family) n=1 Tax=Litoreibacter meonggei TaxID=1049199 RepID=A0A497W9K1_9RHOB|nr:L,D-transpeptidase family protein [Litoreibacter meonggei]RLJ51907.1 L,D-peptidoglycan transpeptidase YkuD (ErfK/YbiS/YcfS/YnhG family) [Litoreibacter meonggei]